MSGWSGPTTFESGTINSDYARSALLSNGNFVVVWAETGGIDDGKFAIFTPEGTTVASGTFDSTTNIYWIDVAALSNGGFMIVYRRANTPYVNLRCVVYTNGGTLSITSKIILADPKGDINALSIVGTANNRVALLCRTQDVDGTGYYMLLSAAGSRIAGPTKITGVSPVSPNSVLLDNGNTMFTFVDFTGDVNSGVKFFIRNSSGGSVVGVTTLTSGSGLTNYPVQGITSLKNGNVFIIYGKNTTASNASLYYQIRTQAGAAVVGETLIENNTTGQLYYSAASLLKIDSTYRVLVSYSPLANGVGKSIEFTRDGVVASDTTSFSAGAVRVLDQVAKGDKTLTILFSGGDGVRDSYTLTAITDESEVIWPPIRDDDYDEEDGWDEENEAWSDSPIYVTAGGGRSNDWFIAVADGKLYYDGPNSTPVLTTTQYDSVDVPQNIVDETEITSDVVVGDDTTITKITVGLGITHTYVSDLLITLVHPDLTEVVLFNGDYGGTGEDFTSTVFDDSADNFIDISNPPFTGTFVPNESLSDFIGKSSLGTWVLKVEDRYAGDTGTLDSWYITVT